MCDVEVARQEWETHFASTNSQAAAESSHCQVLCMQLQLQWLILGFVLCRGKAHPHADCACRGNVDFEDATRL